MEETKNNNGLYTLIPLDDFKAILGVDDREEKTARFCLVTATLSIEQYCKRKFLQKQYFETISFSDSLIIPLKEYPVSEIIAVFTVGGERFIGVTGQIIEPEFYRPMLGNDYYEEIPFEILFSPSIKPYKLSAVKVNYWAGYVVNPHSCGFTTRSFYDVKTPTGKRAASMPPVPADLSTACLELATWNMNRYRGRRVGMTGNIRGVGVQGEHFELSMPENVRSLIEPYRRKTI